MSEARSGGKLAAVKDAPLYLAAYCVLFPLSIFNLHSDYYSWHGIVPASILLLVLAAVTVWLLRRVAVDRQFAGVIALVLMIAFFPRSILTTPIFAAIAVAGIALAALGLVRKNGETGLRLPLNFTYIANLIVAAVAVALVGHAIYDTHISSKAADQITSDRIASFPGSPVARSDLPHIVHIVLDGYSRGDVLQGVYGYDNSAFLDALRARGFRVAEKATSPYNQTFPTMSSIFSLEPLLQVSSFDRPTGDADHYRRMLREVIHDGLVHRVLRDLGYEMRSTPVAFVALHQQNAITVDGEPSLLGRFGFAATYTFTYELLIESPVFNPVATRFLGDHIDVIAVNYHYLTDIPERRFRAPEAGPLFLYQHVLAPHPPFNITRDGERRPLGIFPRALADNSALVQRDNAKRAEYRKGYLEKLRYINTAILRQIDNVQASLTGPLIIIVHSDHGGGMHAEQTRIKETCMHERFSALLAVYATDPNVLAQISDDFNIVNLYRAIFRVTLQADLPDLPARSTFVSWQFDRALPVAADELARQCPTPPGAADRLASPRGAVTPTH